jgi:hypothetical protein
MSCDTHILEAVASSRPPRASQVAKLTAISSARCLQPPFMFQSMLQHNLHRHYCHRFKSTAARRGCMQCTQLVHAAHPHNGKLTSADALFSTALYSLQQPNWTHPGQPVTLRQMQALINLSACSSSFTNFGRACNTTCHRSRSYHVGWSTAHWVSTWKRHSWWLVDGGGHAEGAYCRGS